ncbi:MAG: hypothetical protein DMF75_11270, partial [Acidobacteria bacterium]
MIIPREKHLPQNGEASPKTPSADCSRASFTRFNINVARDLIDRFVRGLFVIFLVASVAVLIPLSTRSQSGRQKPANTNATPNNSNSNTRPRQASKSTNPTTSAKTNSNQESASEAEDIVRITSTLVPVPASVVDVRGVAVTNLKLEDFELRIDGQPNVISDLSRAETPVRMAMLFDNSGSLSEFREFEKRAAIRFFRNVLRPVDQAAVFSVSTDVTLAEPL